MLEHQSVGWNGDATKTMGEREKRGSAARLKRIEGQTIPYTLHRQTGLIVMIDHDDVTLTSYCLLLYINGTTQPTYDKENVLVWVKNVFGLAVAGTNYKRMRTGKHCTVVLLRLSLPTKIGGKLVLHKHTINHQSGSLEDLWTFLGRFCGLDLERNPHKVGFGQGCRPGSGGVALFDFVEALFSSSPFSPRKSRSGRVLA